MLISTGRLPWGNGPNCRPLDLAPLFLGPLGAGTSVDGFEQQHGSLADHRRRGDDFADHL
ncbi:hypothetical protein ACPPVO_57390 [Dactylosporangium sp. McL0621]|uniref:hypothetical protein n=1 Tax=Dactylosporangium sp. McL0621 TaxID=3415678 RepID=UPI003CEC3C9C